MRVNNQAGDLPQYRAHLAARNLRPITINCYCAWVRRLSDWLPCPVDEATPTDLEAWIAAHQWSPNTHQKAVQAIQYYYRWLVATGALAVDPSADLRPARSPRPISRPTPEDAYQAALAAARGQDYWRLRLAADTGLRRSELAAVHSSDVQRLAVGQALHVVGKGGVERWVPLPEDLAAWIRMQRGWAWPAGDGHLTPDGVGKWYARHLGRNVHSLRHRYAALCYRAGHDIEAVSALLGHASVATTQHYLSVADDDLRLAASHAWTPAA